MKKEITMEEYKQSCNEVVGLPIIEIFKAAGTELFFIIENNDGEKWTITVDGVWSYESDNYEFLTEFKNDNETALELYERIIKFVEQELENKITSISEFKFTEKAGKVSIIFNDKSVLNVLPNKFGLISVSNNQKQEAIFAKQTKDSQMIFFQEVD